MTLLNLWFKIIQITPFQVLTLCLMLKGTKDTHWRVERGSRLQGWGAKLGGIFPEYSSWERRARMCCMEKPLAGSVSDCRPLLLSPVTCEEQRGLYSQVQAGTEGSSQPVWGPGKLTSTGCQAAAQSLPPADTEQGLHTFLFVMTPAWSLLLILYLGESKMVWWSHSAQLPLPWNLLGPTLSERCQEGPLHTELSLCLRIFPNRIGHHFCWGVTRGHICVC